MFKFCLRFFSILSLRFFYFSHLYEDPIKMSRSDVELQNPAHLIVRFADRRDVNCALRANVGASIVNVASD